jgi:hypothetical protein
MKSLILVFLLASLPPVSAQEHPYEGTVLEKFASGGTVRLHLEAGGYTISPSDGDDIVITYRANSAWDLDRVRVSIRPAGSTAEVYVNNTPDDHFEAGAASTRFGFTTST